MHELSIAEGILEIVQQYVPCEQAPAVRSVKVRIGRMAGVVADSLEFSFSAIVSDTPWESARLDIEHVPAAGECRSCGSRFEIEDIAFLCPACGGNGIQLVAGTDLQVVEIEMEEDHSEVE